MKRKIIQMSEKEAIKFFKNKKFKLTGKFIGDGVREAKFKCIPPITQK